MYNIYIIYKWGRDPGNDTRAREREELHKTFTVNLVTVPRVSADCSALAATMIF